MDEFQIEEEREKLREHYRKCILVVESDGSVNIVEPDGRTYPWETEDSMRYNGYFREVLARDIFKEVIVKE